jgi:hypothetical protein
VSDQSGCCESKIVSNFEEFLDTLVRNEMTHGCSVVGSNNDTSFERNSHSTSSGFEDALLLGHDFPFR